MWRELGAAYSSGQTIEVTVIRANPGGLASRGAAGRLTSCRDSNKARAANRLADDPGLAPSRHPASPLTRRTASQDDYRLPDPIVPAVNRVWTTDMGIVESLAKQGVRIVGPPPPKGAPKVETWMFVRRIYRRVLLFTVPNLDPCRAQRRPDVDMGRAWHRRRHVAPRIHLGEPPHQETLEQRTGWIARRRCGLRATTSRSFRKPASCCRVLNDRQSRHQKGGGAEVSDEPLDWRDVSPL